MYSEETSCCRRKIRRVVADSLPGCSPELIYAKLKAPFASNLTQSDLIPFCKAVNIPVSKLPQILAPYGIASEAISRKHWLAFYGDEFCSSIAEMPIPENLNPSQIAVLRQFTAAIRARCNRTLADQWNFVVIRNPTGAHPAKVRISAFCRLIAELSLALEQTILIDAVLGFFRKKLDALDFSQFALFMQTFT
jgi:hypothetical protein